MALYVQPVVLPAASGLVYSGAGRVMGWTFRETGGVAAAHLRLWDSSSASGKLITPVSLSADQSTRDWLGPHGLALYQGVFFQLLDGAVEGSVWITTEPDEADTVSYT